MPLKTFIIQEALRNEHAARFILFKERYNSQVFLDLKNALEKEWERDTKSLSKKYKVDEDDVAFSLLQNPKASVGLSVEAKDEKLVSSRHRENIEVSPSIKIPLIYKRAERDLMIKSVLDSAEKAIKTITENWKEIFRIEKKGRATPWFKIVRDTDEIRVQLSLTDGDNEMYKTLYSIRVEYGKAGSKLKDFDRVYLHSLI